MAAIISTDIDAAAAHLRAGDLVGMPTETVYGLAANALDPTATANIFAVKERPAFDPLIIHQASAARVLAFAKNIPSAATKLAALFWPGPLTLVLEKTSVVPDIVTAGLTTVALRVPQHPSALALLKQLDFPVAAPSANPFGFVSPTTAQHVADQLGEKIPFILDGGPCRVGLESTIVGFPSGTPTIYRKGGMAVEDIELALGCPVNLLEHSSSRPQAPGMLSQHYSPGCELFLWDNIEQDAAIGQRDAVVLFGDRGAKYLSERPRNSLSIHNLSPEGNLVEAASRLFAVLREINKRGYREVSVELLPERGLGRAINDRLRRAAARE
ncbi:L-threonylcarbamoyladenylate synthase [Neolewinella antarctica]|uniref:Threonylcarbamoyl-AMP synthase n=1 Tax=Neolewinella antarctica TaxID=442734 RepID=A0ABX0X7J4_9BACT|nr:L-threonylcarbamoyladenylate synthase [Neolewinella antarctica]NJC25117.1 L-threonylcarbamoyladenylate synthase [Neolewinella antarctica]